MVRTINKMYVVTSFLIAAAIMTGLAPTGFIKQVFGDEAPINFTPNIQQLNTPEQTNNLNVDPDLNVAPENDPVLAAEDQFKAEGDGSSIGTINNTPTSTQTNSIDQTISPSMINSNAPSMDVSQSVSQSLSASCSFDISSTTGNFDEGEVFEGESIGHECAKTIS